MHRVRSRQRRGLAEIVGTLMLVLIVVAAAVAFAFFVASYQNQVQREQQAAHNKALEALHIVSVTPRGVSSVGRFNNLSMEIVSADVNAMNLTGFVVNGTEVGVYYFDLNGTTTACPKPVPDRACNILPAFGLIELSLVVPVSGTLNITQSIVLSLFTALSNEFTFTFAPPVAIAKTSFVSFGNQTPVVFDASASFQPRGSDNATIVEYNWKITPDPVPLGKNANCIPAVNGTSVCAFGEEYEAPVPPLAHGANYNVTLTVTDSDGLNGTVTVFYHQQ